MDFYNQNQYNTISYPETGGVQETIEVDVQPGLEVPLEGKWGYPKVLPKSNSKRRTIETDSENMGLLGRMETLNDKVHVRRNNNYSRGQQYQNF